ncbi:MAG: ATP-binding protein [Candidatus Moranbacteria bacterium]|nr:ATP-binding protein [Candidatus Moranbacteria bacterium]
METILCPWDAAKYFIFSANVPQILYYALVPGMLVSIILGFFVFLNDRKSIAAKILLFIALGFFIWGILALILFATNSPRQVMLFWSITILVEPLIYAGCLYLAYVFFDKKDIGFLRKIIAIALILPFILLLSSKYNLIGVKISDCTAIEGLLALYISYAVEIIFIIWIIVLATIRYRKISNKSEKKQVVLFTVGLLFFLFTFSSGNIIGSFTSDWVSSQYGYFGMPIFIGFLAYLIVKYKAFNVKLIASQALVVGLIIGIGAQFFFVQNTTNQILTGITLVIAIIFGWQLVRSVKLEVQRKEELEKLSLQLAEANDKLHQLDKAKSEFISIASHQLRTPLTSIKGFGSLLLEGTYGPVPDTQRNALEKIYISNERLIQLVEDLLNISRMEAGRMEFDFQEGQIEDLVQEAVDTLELSAKAKKLYLHWRKPSIALPKLKIDITKIKEVISNMVDNAIKYTQKGGITVRAERGSFFDHDSRQQKSVVRISVSDTGIGMDKEELESIFNKFERGKDVSHYHTDGTGLGMYVGKKMVEAHHGKIWAESPGKNKGSRFVLELPII